MRAVLFWMELDDCEIFNQRVQLIFFAENVLRWTQDSVYGYISSTVFKNKSSVSRSDCPLSHGQGLGMNWLWVASTTTLVNSVEDWRSSTWSWKNTKLNPGNRICFCSFLDHVAKEKMRNRKKETEKVRLRDFSSCQLVMGRGGWGRLVRGR